MDDAAKRRALDEFTRFGEEQGWYRIRSLDPRKVWWRRNYLAGTEEVWILDDDEWPPLPGERSDCQC